MLGYEYRMSVLLQRELRSLLRSAPRHPGQKALDLWASTVLQNPGTTSLPEHTRKACWELCLRSDILDLAAQEDSAESGDEYYDHLRDKLDVILTLTEHEACDGQFPLLVLEDLLDTQTIRSCSYIFSWMEDRSSRLTKGMEPEKGKSLVLLRTLNQLLRRLSKTAQTIFCGRILTFLSGAYPLGDRSGVNLRGEYGPPWQEVIIASQAEQSAEMEVDLKPELAAQIKSSDETKDKMFVDETEAVDPPQGNSTVVGRDLEDQKRKDFFRLFWSLQLTFSRPNSLTNAGAFERFQASVNTVLPVLAEANKKERLMMGSKALVGNIAAKRKLDTAFDARDDTKQDYFFAKFLTSPDLLELEISDSLFRRQILFQLLIALQYLQLLTKSEKAKWGTPRNLALVVDFVLGSAEAKWVNETWTKVMGELKATVSGGKEFAETVTAILERERNWIAWKNDRCTPFDKPSAPDISQATAPARERIIQYPDDWQWRYGTEALTEIFEMGYRNLDELENVPRFDDLAECVRNIKSQDKKIEKRKEQIEHMEKLRASALAPLPTAKKPDVPAPEIHAASDTSGVGSEVVQLPGASTAGIHPLPPKPGTSSSPSIGPSKPTGPVTAGAPVGSTKPRSKALVPSAVLRDRQLESFESHKRKLSWLALRVARIDHWQLFSAAQGDPEKMMWMIERNKESMKEQDVASFKETGWVEGDTTIRVSQEKVAEEPADAQAVLEGSQSVSRMSNVKDGVDGASTPTLGMTTRDMGEEQEMNPVDKPPQGSRVDDTNAAPSQESSSVS